MPTYTVRCRVDAYVDYFAEVEADSPEEAAELANDDHAAYDWRPDGQQGFDACLYLTVTPPATRSPPFRSATFER